ncbi:hypothetical protein HWB35_gp21 [Lactobacillus phage LJ]|uniref:Uncharacterized protein n=1 Tax=Lactobacillus phage LJ TaxID=2041454 RepID=A0A2D1GPA2_9CAUD|nr:hypothetical protein HWB35_gp21 [Lactobacillus phage LJ]ATN93882.1 hypothetical protein LJ_21 [Lactobacillus phage LJ]
MTSNETKRDVLLYFGDYVLRNFNTPNIIFGGEQVAEYMQRYDNALPDDLPVIPEAVGEWLTWCKERGHSLKDALDGETRVSEDTFARAWLLCVWRVDGTSEIVKLEDVE